MPVGWFFKLYNRIYIIEARRAFRLVNISSYPHVDERGRENIYKRLMIDSGYEKHMEEINDNKKYDASWDILRRFGREKT